MGGVRFVRAGFVATDVAHLRYTNEANDKRRLSDAGRAMGFDSNHAMPTRYGSNLEAVKADMSSNATSQGRFGL